MWTRIKQILALPTFEDREEALTTSLLHTILLTLLALCLLAYSIGPLVDPGLNTTPLLLMLVTVLVLLVYSRRGEYRAVRHSSMILCVAIWALATLTSWDDDGMRNLVTTFYYALALIAGLLLGGNNTLAFGLLCIVSALGLYIGETSGAISVAQRDIEFQDWFKFSLILATVLVLVRFGMSQLTIALEQLRSSEHALSERAQELETANQRLNILGRAKDEFVSNVSHELRTPISSIKLYQDLLSQWPHKLQEYLPKMQRETLRLETLIENLLTLSRLDQDRVDFELDLVELNTLAKEYAHDRKILAERNGLDLMLDINSKRLMTMADRESLGQALSILLTNALNYTPAGGQVVISAKTQKSRGQSWVGMAVQDSGPGIPAKEVEWLFTRFFRGKAGRSSGISGSGLGLAIAKEIVDRHQGRIKVDSLGIPGEGATFTIWLPAAGAAI